jgi:NTP pyrophosphatase (non-canonical NTP hydrolase)
MGRSYEMQWEPEEFFDAGEAVMVVQKGYDNERRLLLKVSHFTLADEFHRISEGGLVMTAAMPAFFGISSDLREGKAPPENFKTAVQKLLDRYNPFAVSFERDIIIYNRNYVAAPAIPEPAQPKPFDFNNYQAGAATTAAYPHNIALLYVVMGLIGEAGEIANKVKKIYRDNGGLIDLTIKQAIAEEAGDVLWYIARLCSELGLSLEDVAKANLNKLQLRQKNGSIGGSGDYR